MRSIHDRHFPILRLYQKRLTQAAIFFVTAIAGIGGVLPVLAQAQDPFAMYNRPAFFRDGGILPQGSVQPVPLGVFRDRSGQTFEPKIEINFDPNAWQPVASKVGRFSILMPPGIMFDEMETLKTAVGDLQFRVLSKNAGDSRYVAAYSDPLAASQLKNPKALLAAVAERVNPTNLFRLTGDRPITIEKYPGRELAFSTNAELIVLRAYLVGNRIYVIGVNHLDKETFSKVGQKFLNSFSLLPPPTTPPSKP